MRNCLKLSLVFSFLVALSSAHAKEYPFTSELTVSTYSVGKLPVPEQTKVLVSTGAKSIWVVVTPWSIDKLQAYRETPEVQSGQLDIGVVRVHMKAGWEYNSDKIKPLLAQVKELGLPLWVYATGKAQDRPQAVELFKRFCEDAAEYDVDIVIYPHAQQIFRNAMESLELIEELGYDNLKLSVMWCHEVKSDAYLDIAQTMDKVAPHTAIVSISGADEKNFQQKAWDWQYAIMPLDRGSIGLKPFLDALSKHQFDGAVFLKNWGIKDDASDYIPRALAKWEQLIEPYAK